VIRNIEKECYFDWRTQIPGELRESILALDINKKIRNYQLHYFRDNAFYSHNIKKKKHILCDFC